MKINLLTNRQRLHTILTQPLESRNDFPSEKQVWELGLGRVLTGDVIHP